MFSPDLRTDVSHQWLMQVLLQLGFRQHCGKTFTEYEAQLYEHACVATTRFAEARALELEADIRKHFPEARPE